MGRINLKKEENRIMKENNMFSGFHAIIAWHNIFLLYFFHSLSESISYLVTLFIIARESYETVKKKKEYLIEHSEFFFRNMISKRHITKESVKAKGNSFLTLNIVWIIFAPIKRVSMKESVKAKREKLLYFYKC